MRLAAPTTSPHERGLVALLLLLFLTFNAATGSDYPWPWRDEVSYADPAANLYLGHGFVSSVWDCQASDRFFAANTPLYPGLLALFFRPFGFSLHSVRAFHLLAMALAGLFFWLALARSQLLRRASSRLAALFLFFCAYGMSFLYRYSRPDTVALLLLCTLFWIATSPHRRRRWLGLAGGGLLIAASGLQVLFYTVLLAVALWLLARRTAGKEAAALCGGSLAGGIGLALFYQSRGALGDFLRATVFSGHTLSGFHWGAEMSPAYLYRGDLSSFLLLAGLLLMAAPWALRQRRTFFRSPAALALALALGLPPLLGFFGKWAIYYSWMVFAPLSIGFFSAAEALTPAARRWLRLPLAAALAASAACGLPYQWLRQRDAAAGADLARLEQFLRRELRPGEWLYTDSVAYYAAKRTAAKVYLPTYATAPSLPAIPEAERRRINALFLPPREVPFAVERLGGGWKLAAVWALPRPGGEPGEIISEGREKMAHLALYRREGEAGAPAERPGSQRGRDSGSAAWGAARHTPPRK